MTAERRISIKTDIQGADQVDGLHKALSRVTTQSGDATKGLWQVGEALTQRTIPPLADYKKLLESSTQAVSMFGGAAVSSLSKLNSEWQKQKTLGQFYGTGTWTTAMLSLNNAAKNFLAGGGRGFTNWLQSSSSMLAQHRMALAGVAAGMTAFGAAAAFSAKNTSNLIDSTLRAHAYRTPDQAKTRAWLESALETDWSSGRSERTAIYDAIMSKRIMNEGTAVTATETIEKFYFANQERLKKMGYGSAEQLAKTLTSSGAGEEELRMITGKYGMDKQTAVSRLNILKSITDTYDMADEAGKRPEDILRKRLEHTTTNIGKVLIPVLNSILGAFLRLSSILGKIPGADKLVGWGVALTAGVAVGALFLSVAGGMLGNILLLTRVLRLDAAAHLARAVAIKAATVASYLAAAASKALGIAVSSAMIMTGVGALLVLAGVLVGLAYKTGYLQKAWDKFKGSAIGKDVFKGLQWGAEQAQVLFGYIGKAFDRMDKAYSKGGLGGVLKTVLEFSSPGFKIIQFIGQQVRHLVDKSETLNKLAKHGTDLFQKIHGFIEKLLTIISRMRDGIDNLLSQLPGAEKREATVEWETAMKRRGLTYRNGQYYTASGNPVTEDEMQSRYKNVWDKGVTVQNTPGFFGDLVSKLALMIPGAEKEALRKEWVSAYLAAGMTEYAGESKSGHGYRTASGNWADETPSLKALREAYENQPGFAEGIADAVAKGVSAAMSSVLDVDKLTEAIDSLARLIEIKFPTVSGTEGAAKEALTGPPGSGKEAVVQGGAMALVPGYGTYKSGAMLKDWLLPKADAGGEILSSGPLIGHGGEEIVPARVRQGGKTVLERILNYGYGAVGPASGSGSPQPVSVKANVTVEIGQVRDEADVDQLIERIRSRLLFEIRSDLENLQMRNIGYYRG